MKEFTEKGKDPIEAIRNNKRAYPNGQKELLFLVQQLFDEFIDE